MPDSAVFPIRKTKPTLKQLYAISYLGIFAFFLATGNFFRLIQIAYFPSHFSVIEALCYGWALPLYFCRLRRSLFILTAITLSCFYGTILHGVDGMCILYAIKLEMMIIAGVSLAEAMQQIFGHSLEKAMAYLLIPFTTALLIGGAMYVFFLQSSELFIELEKYGVFFSGDSHVGRFISPFFDPNYYAAIACIPLIICWNQRSLSPKYGVIFFLFLASIILTWSRSGIATMLLLTSCMGGKFLLEMLQRPLTKQKMTCILGSFLTFFSILIVQYDDIIFFIQRTVYFFYDGSALARLETFNASKQFLWEYPFWGTGYNYLSPILLKEIGIYNPDSSLLLTILSFGILPTLAIFSYGIFWFFRRMRVLKKTTNAGSLFSWLYFYLIICILFTSQFNNLLYYQFWLIPVIGIFTYLDREMLNNCCFKA